ncbi:hypothetical protein ACFSHT_01315 [Paraburkholderia silviterrae]|uniref:Uncharacterized protein n=1 Tax=Paraburkholderia silviterrae TaxID=2528715 RepID=A0A4R5MHG6_9BURK|nr:hypothetical protein [Paraburkholderia silviterrae]TDG26240.1 hypothetical protein EYW47_02515 [Paraburkholderia silviterrae]
MTEAEHEIATGHSAHAWTQGWNWLVIAIVVVAPLVLILVEYKLRDELCALRARHAYHPLDFFSPTMMAAALTMALPCMSMPGSLPRLIALPRPPSIFYFSYRRRWACAHRAGIRHNRTARYLWHANVGVAVFALFLSCGIFVLWLLRLHPEGSASIADTWGTPQKESCTAYGIAASLTLLKATLERLEK